MCLNVSPPPPPTPTFMRSEPLVVCLEIEITRTLTLTLLCICMVVHILSHIDLNCRFITFDTRLNTLTVSAKERRHDNLDYCLLVLSYFSIFEFYFVVFLPLNLSQDDFDIRMITKVATLFKTFHMAIINTTSRSCIHIAYITIACMYHFPFEVISIWVCLMRLVVCPDIHPNPGPAHSNNFTGGFLSFCNWNLNTLSKEDFYRITLLEAHNTQYNYDIISLCETSLDDATTVPDMPGYKFHSCNHPDGNRSGGVGIFYKESLPLKIREDLSFSESIVCELIFGHKHIFFTVLYRNPMNKANSDEFNTFIESLENLNAKIKNLKPYAMFFTGDFNAHSHTWYPEGDTNPEGVALDNLFTDLNLTQIISEPTHFMRDTCRPTCIDLVITDQPNLVLDCGVRDSLDITVKHKIIFCKINFKIPPPPKYSRKIWHFNRAHELSIRQAVSMYPWGENLGTLNPNRQVDILNQTILNIMSNFVPNEVKTVCPREPKWMNRHIKTLSRKRNKVFKRYKLNGYKIEDKNLVDRLRTEYQEAVVNAKENYLKNLGSKYRVDD